MRSIHTSIPNPLASRRMMAGLLAGLFLWAAPAGAQVEGPVMPASGPAPALQYKDDAGQLQTVDYAAHKLTALHLWATWCVPCVDELPVVDQVSATYGSKGLRVIPLSLDGNNIAKVKQFYTEHKITHLPAYLDNGTAAFKALKAPGLPVTVFVNQKGEMIGRSDGPLDWKSDKTKAFIENGLK